MTGMTIIVIRPRNTAHVLDRRRHQDKTQVHARSSKRRRHDSENSETETIWVEKDSALTLVQAAPAADIHMLPTSDQPQLSASGVTASRIEKNDQKVDTSGIAFSIDRLATQANVLPAGGTSRAESISDERIQSNRDLGSTEGNIGVQSTSYDPLDGEKCAYLGSERAMPQKHPPRSNESKMSRYELNKQIFDDEGLRREEVPSSDSLKATPAAVPRPSAMPSPGSAGWDWRMKKLQRTFDAAQEEGRPIERVALERYGSMAAFEEAKYERNVIDGGIAKRKAHGKGIDVCRPVNQLDRGLLGPANSNVVARRFLINQTDLSPQSSLTETTRRDSFRRPGELSQTPRSQIHNKATTQISSVFAHSASVSASGEKSSTPGSDAANSTSPTSLNRLHARVMKANLIHAPEATALEEEYEEAISHVNGRIELADNAPKVHILPSLDAKGRLYDIGAGQSDAGMSPTSGIGKRKEDKVQTHDPNTGKLLQVNADDDTTSLEEMVRQERYSAGLSDQKNMDAEFASRIAGDMRFDANLDYIEENAEQLARKKMRTDAQKRMFAMNDYAKTQKALNSCPYCFLETTSQPRVPVVALGTQVYLALTQNEGLVEGHCLIVPLQHHLSTLDADDDTWEEIKNFMKTLMQAFAEHDLGVIFFETVVNLQQQRHSVLECVPVSWDVYEICPAFFKEAILSSEGEWTQHKKLIDFSARTGGFRRSLVPNLPYFAVMWDYRGNKGYGHIIEGIDKSLEQNEAYDVDENARSGLTEFSGTFAHEILGQIMQLEPRRWRRPKRLGREFDAERVANFKNSVYSARFDWTLMLAAA